ncbi:MAG: hypothetical protein GXO58_10340 [Thermodesulfobacteria bacterium]|nr:hypothetical protein [Thermodesulfobacteriota bacterium]
MIDDLKSLIRDQILAVRQQDLLAYLGMGQGHDQIQTKISPITKEQVKEIEGLVERGLLHRNYYFYACDLFIRQKVEPAQEMLDQWMSGAKAQVGGEDIKFSNIISWCQYQDSKEKRDHLEREARALCRFLSPFSEATWQTTFRAVTEDLGYSDYLGFLRKKRGSVLDADIENARSFLEQTRDGYFTLIDTWFERIPEPVIPGDRSRFDAIYLLGMRYLDSLYPDDWKGEEGVNKAVNFFQGLVRNLDGLNIHITSSSGGNPCCLPVSIPGEVHVIAGPLGGWIDLEGLFHELGHALFFLGHSEELPFEARELFLEPALSEAFAFLFQLVSLDTTFLTRVMGLGERDAEILSIMQKVKFLTLARRYSAKSITEYENFKGCGRQEGKRRYAQLLERHTGFRYQPETYYFDLMPDLYSLDYFKAFVASLSMERHLEGDNGPGWFLHESARELLGKWAFCGNTMSLEQFMIRHLGMEACHEPFDFAINGPLLDGYVKKMAQNV